MTAVTRACTSGGRSHAHDCALSLGAPGQHFGGPPTWGRPRERVMTRKVAGGGVPILPLVMALRLGWPASARSASPCRLLEGVKGPVPALLGTSVAATVPVDETFVHQDARHFAGCSSVSRSTPSWAASANSCDTRRMSATTRPAYQGHRHPKAIIAHAVWLSFRLPLSYRDVEELLAARGVLVTDETIRQWYRKFGQAYANALRRRQPWLGDKWHLDRGTSWIASCSAVATRCRPGSFSASCCGACATARGC